MRWAAPLLLLAAAACGPAQDDGPNPVEQRIIDEFPEPAEPPVETLAGEWRVARIDGASLDQPYGIALSGDEGEIWWEPRCAGMVRRYRIDGHQFAAESLAAPPPPEGSPPVPPRPVCAIGLPPRLTEAVRALDAADTIIRNEQNGIEISGGGHSLTLFAQ